MSVGLFEGAWVRLVDECRYLVECFATNSIKAFVPDSQISCDRGDNWQSNLKILMQAHLPCGAVVVVLPTQDTPHLLKRARFFMMRDSNSVFVPQQKVAVSKTTFLTNSNWDSDFQSVPMAEVFVIPDVIHALSKW